MISPGLARYTCQMADHDALAFRQLVTHLGYSTDRALDAVGRTDLLPEDHHSRTAGRAPVGLRTEAGGAKTERARGFSSISARPEEIHLPFGSSEDHPVELGAQAPLAPPFWLAELRGIARLT